MVLRADPPSGERLARIIGDDRRPGIVVDVPLSWRSGIDLVGSPFLSPRAMVQQTIHHKPIAAGYIARLDRSMLDRLLARPLYRALLIRQGGEEIPPGLASAGEGRRGFGRTGTRSTLDRRVARGGSADSPVPGRHRVPPPRRRRRSRALHEVAGASAGQRVASPPVHARPVHLEDLFVDAVRRPVLVHRPPTPFDREIVVDDHELAG